MVTYLRVGSIYRVYYAQWKTNIKPVIFVLYPGINKIHALNLAATQLSSIQRTQLVMIIKRLSKVEATRKYPGYILYRIFRRYAPDAIRNSYRTYFRANMVSQYLVNYGLNKAEDFSELELQLQSKYLAREVKYDFFIKTMNMYTGQGVKKSDLPDQIFTPSTTRPNPQTGDAPVEGAESVEGVDEAAEETTDNQGGIDFGNERSMFDDDIFGDDF